MYHTFYHLWHDPFASTPDPALFFASASHRAALHGILQGIAQGQHCITLLGKAGLGKTLVLRACRQRLETQGLTVLAVVYAHITFDDIGKMLCQAVGVPEVSHDTPTTGHTLHQVFCTAPRQRRPVVLLIDEAHKLPRQTLDHLLQFVHLYAATGEGLVQLVLTGLPEFRQSVPGRVLTLSRLTYQESLEYMQHRLGHMASCLEAVFSAATAKRIATLARGNPGVLNTLCTNVLIAGAVHQQKPVSLALAQEVLAPYATKRPSWQRGAVYAASALLVASLFGGAHYSARRFLSTGVFYSVPLAQLLLETWYASSTQSPAPAAWHAAASAASTRAPQGEAPEAPPGESPRPAEEARLALPDQTVLVMPDVPTAMQDPMEARAEKPTRQPLPVRSLPRVASQPPGKVLPQDEAFSMPPDKVIRRLAELRAQYRSGGLLGVPPALAPASPAAPPGQTAAGREPSSPSVVLSATAGALTGVKPVPAPQVQEPSAHTPARVVRRRKPRRSVAAATASPAIQQGDERRRVRERQEETPVETAAPSHAMLETGRRQGNAGRAPERPGGPPRMPPAEVRRRLAELRAQYRSRELRGMSPALAPASGLSQFLVWSRFEGSYPGQ